MIEILWILAVVSWLFIAAKLDWNVSSIWDRRAREYENKMREFNRNASRICRRLLEDQQAYELDNTEDKETWMPRYMTYWRLYWGDAMNIFMKEFSLKIDHKNIEDMYQYKRLCSILLTYIVTWEIEEKF